MCLHGKYYCVPSPKKYTNSPTVENMKQKGLVNIVLIIAIVIFVNAVGYFAFVRKSAPISRQSTPTPARTTTPVSPTSISENETANWAVYSNTKYNYSFRYPTNFTIYAATDQTKEEVILPTATSNKVFLTDKKAMLFCCEPLVTSVSVVNGLIDIKNWRQYAEIPDYRIKSQGEIIFSGHKAFEVRGSLGIDSAGVRLILIPGNKFSFILIQGDDGEPWKSITNSFHFK